MPDQDLPVRRLMRILSSYGVFVEFTKNNFIKARRSFPGGEVVYWMQHCHRGLRDTIPRLTAHAARRRLRLRQEDGIPDSEFYSRA